MLVHKGTNRSYSHQGRALQMADVFGSSQQTGVFLAAGARECLRRRTGLRHQGCGRLYMSAAGCATLRPGLTSDTSTDGVAVLTTLDSSRSGRIFLRTSTGSPRLLRRGSLWWCCIFCGHRRGKRDYSIDCSELLETRGVPAGVHHTINVYHLVHLNSSERNPFLNIDLFNWCVT